MNEKRYMKLASRGKRLGAACIDSLIPFAAYMIYTSVLTANGIDLPDSGLGYGYGSGYEYGYEIGSKLSGASATIIGITALVLTAYMIVELVLFARGQSIGKAILGMQVVSSLNGSPFGFWKTAFREIIVKSASGSVFALGYIWVLFDSKNRGWHDKILDSYVVDLRESEKIAKETETANQ